MITSDNNTKQMNINGMEPLVKNVGACVKDIQIVAHPTEKDCFGIRLVFTCHGCKRDYHLDEYDKEKCDAFLESMVSGSPNRNIFCVKCNNHIN